MRAARAARQVSRLGWCCGARRNAGCGLGDAWMVQKRALWGLRLLRGLHDVVGHALTMGETAAGVRSPGSAGSNTESLAETKSSQSWRTSSPIAPTADPTSPAALSEQIRSIMRLLPHSVVVCTSTHDQAPRAMTMSSFTSLTLFPTPLISFNIATPSRTLDAITQSGHFNIHIMAGDELGVQVADRFTRGNTDDVFGGLDYDAGGTDGAPPLLRGEGVMYALRCRLLSDEPTGGLMRVRDHVIVVGEVVEMVPGSCGKEFGLAYADRKYRQVGKLYNMRCLRGRTRRRMYEELTVRRTFLVFGVLLYRGITRGLDCMQGALESRGPQLAGRGRWALSGDLDRKRKTDCLAGHEWNSFRLDQMPGSGQLQLPSVAFDVSARWELSSPGDKIPSWKASEIEWPCPWFEAAAAVPSHVLREGREADGGRCSAAFSLVIPLIVSLVGGGEGRGWGWKFLAGEAGRRDG
ncbi:hypothetical protein CCMA1212_008120 [Trichoderma ghanense]|uniref:Flavin reductase like domain-containing protein n=1 Tax=Trichoderma ghanense TaxID=65468 RepID=A0ABY2GVZ9_9HYPO